jgi:formyltetrahydrofolate deformylase
VSVPVKPPATLVALLHGPDQPGLVAKTAGWIYARQGNILHADQHRDMEAGEFFQRIEWVPAFGAARADQPPAEPAGVAQEVADLQAFAASLGMSARVAYSAHRPKGAIFVSQADHCFHDLLLRGKAGEFAGDFTTVISNHADLAGAARHYGLSFHHVPVVAGNKPAERSSSNCCASAAGDQHWNCSARPAWNSRSSPATCRCSRPGFSRRLRGR